jgi:alkylated DNA repair dioxygenase AlkB
MYPSTVEDEHLEWQGSLFAMGDPGFDSSFAGVQRILLDGTSWLDHLPGWLQGADVVFAELVARLPWKQRRVRMYERMLDEPRLTSWWADDGTAPTPLPLLDDLRVALSTRYERHFDSIGFNLYRTGADSVAWHGDRLRHTHVDPAVVIVSVGAPRPFLVRPRGGGPSRSFLLGQGDLFVMGGACQHDWEHTVPKVAAASPRLSITYRHDTAEPADALGPPRAG